MATIATITAPSVAELRRHPIPGRLSDLAAQTGAEVVSQTQSPSGKTQAYGRFWTRNIADEIKLQTAFRSPDSRKNLTEPRLVQAGYVGVAPCFVNTPDEQTWGAVSDGKETILTRDQEVVYFPQREVPASRAEELEDAYQLQDMIWLFDYHFPTGTKLDPYEERCPRPVMSAQSCPCCHFDGHNYVRVERGEQVKWYVNDPITVTQTAAGIFQADDILFNTNVDRFDTYSLHQMLPAPQQEKLRRFVLTGRKLSHFKMELNRGEIDFTKTPLGRYLNTGFRNDLTESQLLNHLPEMFASWLEPRPR